MKKNDKISIHNKIQSPSDHSGSSSGRASPSSCSSTPGNNEHVIREVDRVNLLSKLIRSKDGDFTSTSSSSAKYKSTSSPRISTSQRLSITILSSLFKLTLIISIASTLVWFHVRLSRVETDLSSWTLVHQNEKSSINGGGRFDVFQEVSPYPNENIKGGGNTEESNGIGQDATDLNDAGNQSERTRTTNQRVKRRVGHDEKQHSNKRSKGHVEIINPKLREEMEGKRLREDDGENLGVSQTGSVGEGEYTGEAGSDPDWLWLTSYSRIPVQAFEDFCAGTQKYCPAAPAGPEGKHGKAGPRGEKGDHGFSGERGPIGIQGLPGYPGLRGASGPTGLPGQPGSDGRDGLPGEPGLDGIPGRNGLDGIPGLPGTTGLPGIGRNGTDGIPGQNGLRGPPGPTGTTGLPGQRGLTGIRGEGGKDGFPGTTACELNCSRDSRGPTQGLVLAPSIVGSEIGALRPLVVREGDNVRLRCTATGIPRPIIAWRREDSGFTAGGQWSVSDTTGPILNLTSINRRHMGKYICLASNGINPPASRVYQIEVLFPPFIKILTPEVHAVIGSNATLECFVEAYQRGVWYWETSDTTLLSSSEKYQLSDNISDVYKIRMVLTITKTTHADMRLYLCVSKNDFKTVKGKVRLREVHGTQPTWPPYEAVQHGPTQTYGEKSPTLVDMPDECPPPPPAVCKTCPPRIEPIKCNSGVYHLLDYTHFKIGRLGNYPRPINDSDPGKRNSSVECFLSAVGKPVYHGVSNFNGSWMRETLNNQSLLGEKYWVTNMNEKRKLYEYFNKTKFTLGESSKTYSLQKPFQGNSQAVYNGSFFYVKEKDSTDEIPTIIRYGLVGPRKEQIIQEIKLPYASFKAQRLYRPSDKRDWIWVDLAVDENGLWAMHSLNGSDNLAVVKLDLDDENQYVISYGWNIEIFHKHAGDMFIICGIIYAVDDVNTVETKIRLALDLYQEKLLKVDLPFINPFSDTVMVSYNPKTKQLFTWDKGNQLMYPIKQVAVHPPEIVEERTKSTESYEGNESK